MSPDLERLIRDSRELLPRPSAAATTRARESVLHPLLHRRRGRVGATAAVVVLAVAVVGAATALGVAPRGDASEEPRTGLGFLPATGWTIVQAGHPGTPVSTTAVAANVPVHAEDADGGLPYATLQSLPRHGVVIAARFGPGGPDGRNAYPLRRLPLRLADFRAGAGWSTQARAAGPLGHRTLRGTVNGYRVEVDVYFGTEAPSARMLATAQRQLDALVVAADEITIQAIPLMVPYGGRVQLSGAVASGRAGEEVTLEERWCGSSAFAEVVQTKTVANGAWHLDWTPTINTTVRVRWKGSASATVTLRTRPGVNVSQKTRRVFNVGVVGRKSFWQRTAQLERFDRARNRWVLVKRFRLTESNAVGVMQWSTAKVTATVPRNVLVRVVLPASQTGGCYLAGYSNMLRTR